MSRRFMGKLAFFKLVDASGAIQASKWHHSHGRNRACACRMASCLATESHRLCYY
jgi:lysyl-tRNA synthetase class II